MRRVPGGVGGGWPNARRQQLARAVGSAAPRSRAHWAARQAESRADRAERSTIGRRLRETEQAMVKAQKRVDTLHAELTTATDHTVPRGAPGSRSLRHRRNSTSSKQQWLELAELAE